MQTGFDLAWRMSLFGALLAAGWLARRRGWLGAEATRVLSRLCTDLCFPCLTLTQMIRIVGQMPLAEQASLLIIGAFIMAVAIGCGRLAASSAPPATQSAAWLSAAMPNWIFLPLPIATLLYGAEGVATVLVVNLVAQLCLWSIGVAMLRGFRATAREGLRHVLNPGLSATVAGILIATFLPDSRAWFERSDAVGHLLGVAAAVGSLTIPLSMLVTGSQLGAIPLRRINDPLLRRVLVIRLGASPALTLMGLAMLSQFFPSTAAVWRTAVLIASMPVAISCGVLVERYGGDRELTSRSILWSTAAALVTVPLFVGVSHCIFR